jgi:hypothetical protein
MPVLLIACLSAFPVPYNKREAGGEARPDQDCSNRHPGGSARSFYGNLPILAIPRENLNF